MCNPLSTETTSYTKELPSKFHRYNVHQSVPSNICFPPKILQIVQLLPFAWPSKSKTSKIQDPTFLYLYHYEDIGSLYPQLSPNTIYTCNFHILLQWVLTIPVRSQHKSLVIGFILKALGRVCIAFEEKESNDFLVSNLRNVGFQIQQWKITTGSDLT